ncbi:hypothetical protein BEL04_04620 [Mucilaginibacter sp. PPCGB 2223]|nr:hypothetical protein BEL04_04620 [Mucilaginibacter sp. PPCGB 2223]
MLEGFKVIKVIFWAFPFACHSIWPRLASGQAFRLYCTGISHRAGIPACRQAGASILNANFFIAMGLKPIAI